ncbi:MAG: hypothetical protein QGF12_00395 [SAR202 cluster bacterium]|nr:hypothetical protein [SAR202 cluster bacterium]
MPTLNVRENTRMKLLAMVDEKALVALTEKNREHLLNHLGWMDGITTVSARTFLCE